MSLCCLREVITAPVLSHAGVLPSTGQPPVSGSGARKSRYGGHWAASHYNAKRLQGLAPLSFALSA